MTWTYSYHRFEDEAAYRRALEDLEPGVIEALVVDEVGGKRDLPQQPMVPGEPAVLPPDAPVYPAAEAPPEIPDGWHVNLARPDGMALPVAFAAAEVHPATPWRVFA